MRSHSTRMLVAALCAAAAVAQEPEIGVEELDEAVQWFDGLGYPAIADRPLVRVATGAWYQSGREPRRNSYVHGFLLDDDGATFAVLTLDLVEQQYTRTPPKTEAHQRVGYEVVPFKDFAQRTLEALRGLAADEDPYRYRALSFPAMQHAGGTELFVLAWAVRQQGHPELGLGLAGQAVGAYLRRDRKLQGRSLRDLLAKDLGHAAMWRLIRAFGDLAVSYPELLARCERFIERFPDSEHVERAEKTRAILKRMVATERPRVEPADLAELDEPARIAELVYQLRDQNGQQWSQPGSCDVFADPRGEGSPAHQLVAIGFPAVPALIEVLDDDGFTRSVGFHRDFYFSHQVLRLSDVTRAVLAAISGRGIGDRRQAERWWQELQRRGEQAMLIDGVATGDGASPEQARRLLARDPDAVVDAVAKGLEAANNTWIRERLTAVVGGVPGEHADALLRARMTGDAEARPRVAAAICLFLRGYQDEAIDAMIAQWRALWRNGPSSSDADVEAVGTFLCCCGERRAIAALAEYQEHLDDDLIDALAGGAQWLPSVHTLGGVTSSRYQMAQPDAGTDSAIEDLLVELLASDAVISGNFGGVADPRIADFAARAMSRRWPDRYHFDFEAPRVVRDRQIRKLVAGWRVAQGLPPLPPEPEVEIPPVPEESLRPLFDRLDLERSKAPRAEVLAAIEALGLGALPAVRARAEAAECEARAELEGVASRLASRVRVVRNAGLAQGPVPLSELQALAGHRLQGAALSALLAGFCADPPAGLLGITIDIARPDNGTGVVVTFAFTAGASEGLRSVARRASVTTGVRGLHGVSGTAVRHLAATVAHYEEFAAALDQALAAPALEPVEARIALRFQ